MARSIAESTLMYDPKVIQGMKYHNNTQTLAAALTLLVNSPPVQFLDPGGADRNVGLPAEAASAGLTYIIVNTADAVGEDLVVRDDTPATVITIGYQQVGVVYCNGTVWLGYTSGQAAPSQLLVAQGTTAAITGAATLNTSAGKVTTESLTTAQDAIYTLTLTNAMVTAASLVFASVADGTNTQGTPIIGQVNPGAGAVLIEVINQHASAQAFNGTLEISFLVVN